MIFADLPGGASIFLDSNPFIYHYSNHARFATPCRDLLERIARQEIAGFTSAHVLSEVAHRLMTYEAMARFGWQYAGIVSKLKKHPAEVQALTDFRQSVETIPHFGVQVLPIEHVRVLEALAISQQTGLLHNDALIVAVMRFHGITSLASVDGDFDRVPGITRYAPV